MTTLLSALALAAGLVAPFAAMAHDGRHASLIAANGIEIDAGYATVAGPAAPTGAAYMRITNTTAADDRLVAVRSDAAARVELHSHVVEDGVARMRPLANGIDLPAGATVTLENGGLHVMLMGTQGALAPGGDVEMVLVFATAGEIPVTFPVDAISAEHQH